MGKNPPVKHNWINQEIQRKISEYINRNILVQWINNTYEIVIEPYNRCFIEINDFLCPSNTTTTAEKKEQD